MAVNSVGGPPPIGVGVQQTETNQQGNVKGSSNASTFQSQLNPASSAGIGKAHSPELSAAVQDVARDIQTGNVAKGEPAIHAVIEGLVTRSAPEGLSKQALAAKVELASSTLSSDPAFQGRVENLIGQALAAACQVSDDA